MTTLVPNTPVTVDVDADETVHFELAVTAGSIYVIRLAGDPDVGDVDVIAAFNEVPDYDTAELGSWNGGNDEELFYTATETGTLHIGLYGYDAAVGVVLEVELGLAAEAGGDVLVAGAPVSVPLPFYGKAGLAAYGAGVYVTAQRNPRAREEYYTYSLDGARSFKPCDSNVFGDGSFIGSSLAFLAYGNSKFVALRPFAPGYPTDIAESSNGRDWERTGSVSLSALTGSSDDLCSNMIWTGAKFLALANMAVISSADGTSFSQGSTGFSQHGSSFLWGTPRIAHNGSVVCAVGGYYTNGGVGQPGVLVSTTLAATSWARTFLSGYQLVDVTALGGTFWAVTNEASSRVYSSSDGSTWTLQATLPGRCHRITHDGTRLFAYANIQQDPGLVFVSTGGTSWAALGRLGTAGVVDHAGDGAGTVALFHDFETPGHFSPLPHPFSGAHTVQRWNAGALQASNIMPLSPYWGVTNGRGAMLSAGDRLLVRTQMGEVTSIAANGAGANTVNVLSQGGNMAYGNGRAILLDNGGNVHGTDDGGRNWTMGADVFTSDFAFAGPVFVPGVGFVATANFGSTVYVSANGLTGWVAHTHGYTTSGREWGLFGTADGKIVLLGAQHTLISSNGGASFTRHDPAPLSTTASLGNGDCAYNPVLDRFVVVADGLSHTSANAIDWEFSGYGAFDLSNVWVTALGAGFVVWGNSTPSGRDLAMSYTTDGKKWSNTAILPADREDDPSYLSAVEHQGRLFLLRATTSSRALISLVLPSFWTDFVNCEEAAA